MPDLTIWTIIVSQDEDGGGYAASYLTGDEREGGMGAYSTTPLGALAELIATLIKVAEDKIVERASVGGETP